MVPLDAMLQHRVTIGCALRFVSFLSCVGLQQDLPQLPGLLLKWPCACAQACRAPGMASTDPQGSASRQARHPPPAPSPPPPHTPQHQVRLGSGCEQRVELDTCKQQTLRVVSYVQLAWDVICALEHRRLLTAVLTLVHGLCRRQPVPVVQGGGAQ